jgi:hypothetical protein
MDNSTEDNMFDNEDNLSMMGGSLENKENLCLDNVENNCGNVSEREVLNINNNEEKKYNSMLVIENCDILVQNNGDVTGKRKISLSDGNKLLFGHKQPKAEKAGSVDPNVFTYSAEELGELFVKFIKSGQIKQVKL